MEKQDLSKFYDTIINIPALITKQKNEEFSLRRHNLVVSSRDRNLTNYNFNKYNFKVDFGVEGDTTIIERNKDHTSSNPNAVTDTAVKYTSSNINNPNLLRVLKNIVEIKISRVIIPRPRDEVFYPDPYYFVSIEEFDSNVLTTKKFNDKIFCKVHFDKELVFGGMHNSAVSENDEGAANGSSNDNGRKYLYLKMMIVIKKYFIMPIIIS